MDNKIIESFKNQLSVEKVLGELMIDYTLKNDEAFFICPFHEEKTASFSININSGIFSCFGCGEKGGDVIKFIMKYKTLGFVQSLELLSELTQVPLPKDVEEIDKNQLIQRKLITMRQGYVADTLSQDFTDIYQFILDRSSKEKAVEYLKTRGIPNTEQVVEEMNVRLLEKYEQVSEELFKAFKPTRLLKAGVINEKQNLIFYNHRLMLPFFDDSDIVYLSARTLEKDHKPKYLNLSNVVIPDMYNINARRNNTVFLCEGQTDTLSLVGLGIPAIGIAGANNIDTKALEALEGKNVIIAFDNDIAGDTGKQKLLEVLKYIASSVSVYEFKEKDINLHIQSEQNKENIKRVYRDATSSSNINR